MTRFIVIFDAKYNVWVVQRKRKFLFWAWWSNGWLTISKEHATEMMDKLKYLYTPEILKNGKPSI